MRSFYLSYKTVCIYLLVIASFLLLPLWGNRAVMVNSENLQEKNILVIDAGHGGIDSGAVSCTGIYESHINLQIATKLRDLAHLLGLSTIMIRDSDRSIYTDGTTIAAQKISDMKERVRIINTTPNALLVSIHQNTFHDSRYSGAQVFYNNLPESKLLADNLQAALRQTLDKNNKRQAKNGNGIYIMEHSNCPGVLIECGFLSNPQEEYMLRDESYQNTLCSIIVTSLHKYLNT